MKNTNEIIINLIKANASLNEITSAVNLSHKQLFHRLNMLKIKGYDFKRKYYYNGDISYNLVKDIKSIEKNVKTIITSPQDTEFKALFISDLHLGHISEVPELLDEVYNYSIKEGINIIINTGDLVDGTFTHGGEEDKKIKDVEKQVEHLLKVYPFDRSILNFICLGNHDLSCLERNGIDLDKVLKNKRHDLISLGYGIGYINVKNDQICVKHPKTADITFDKSINQGLILYGHYHEYKNMLYGNKVKIYLPTLSSMNSSLPSIIKANISFNNGIFNIGVFEHFIFIDKKIIKVSENHFELFKGKNINNTIIKNQETRKELSDDAIDRIIINATGEETNYGKEKEEPKKLKLTQVEKFNKKWSK